MLNYVSTRERSTRVGRVDFTLLSAAQVRALSVAEVNDIAIYNRGMPQPGGINDHRMGTVDRRLLCGTCGRDVRACQGHTGHIALALPCYHIGFVEMTLKVLRTVCFFCCRPCLSAEELAAQPALARKARFAAAYAAARHRRRCPHCDAPRPAYTRTAAGGIGAEWPADAEFECAEEEQLAREPFTPRVALSVLNGVSEADAHALGLSHPRDLLVQDLLVPPPIARPAIMASEGSRARGQDDLTHRLQDILKRSTELRALLAGGAPLHGPAVTERWARLQLEVFGYMSSSGRPALAAARSKGGGGAAPKSIVDRLKGKEGRVRGHLMGKRVDFSARSVITPDPLMDVDQVGVPQRIAMTLTVPERVTPANIAELRQRVLNGSGALLGAECVITSDKRVIHLDSCADRAAIRLQYGWVVERFLRDGDHVIFNRQPSLHRMGMMGHRVVVMGGSTFRLNLSCAQPYNADFDGDEMNMHVPQSPCATAEVAHLMAVGRQLISPQANKPCMGVVQDALLGAHLLTRPGVLLDRRAMLRCVAWRTPPDGGGDRLALPPPAVLRPRTAWTGAQLFSLLLPSGLTLARCEPPQVGAMPRAQEMMVRGGALLFGTLGKPTLGTATGGLIDVLYRDFGAAATTRFMSDVQRVAHQWLLGEGFSVGIADCVLGARGEAEVGHAAAHAVANASAVLQEAVPRHMADEAEGTVVRILSRLLTQTGDAVGRHLRADNAIAAMVRAGSKGNPINLSQICGCVGQQSVEGRRVHPRAAGGRTLACYAQGERGVHAHGFVVNSYALGLAPQEYFFHAMGGREGLVDTAVKTATTGYIQRRQMKAMEDNRAAYDGTVRNAQNKVIEFLYGGDGADPCRLERQRLEALHLPDERLAALFGEGEVAAAELARLRPLLGALRRGRRTAVAPALDATVLLPVDLERLVRAAALCADGGAPISAEAASDAVGELLDALAARDRPSLAMRAAAAFHLRSARVAGTLRLGASALAALCATVLRRFDDARVAPGDMVGAIAAQSLGEPATQMTLNTFHLSGVANAGMTMGIPRLKELLDFSKRIRTPTTTLVLRADAPAGRAERLAAALPRLRLAQVVTATELLDEPPPRGGEEEAGGAAQHEADALSLAMDAHFCAPPEGAGRWVARLALDRVLLRRYGLTPPALARLVRRRLRGLAHVVGSETNSAEWWLRLRYLDAAAMAERGFAGQERDMERNLTHRVTLAAMERIALGGHAACEAATASEQEHWDEAACANVRRPVVVARGLLLESAGCLADVDWAASTSNDVSSVLETLGIEAAAAVLYQELVTTISFDGTYVDPRHLRMVADTMTYRGYVMPISRHGLNSVDTGPLVRCSFEETADVLYEAALYGESDDAKGVTQNVMTGQMTSAGTGAFDVLLPDTGGTLDEVRAAVFGGGGGAAAEASSASSAGGTRRPLAKALVRHHGAPVERPTDTIEYVDKHDWHPARAPPDSSSAATRSSPGLPFTDAALSDGFGCYAPAVPPPSATSELFVPTSPRRAVELRPAR